MKNRLDSNTGIPLIEPDELATLLSKEKIKVYIIDCRFGYEFDGGHIRSAMNFHTPEDLQNCFFKNIDSSSVFVFHCEYSQHRGPILASSFREYDRNTNRTRYPFLFYPNVFLLEGGYNKFFSIHPELCDGGYVPMKVMKGCSDENIRAWDNKVLKRAIKENPPSPGIFFKYSK